MSEEYEPPIMTRREALSAGSAAAVAVGAAYYSNALIQSAQAATAGDPRILMGDAGVDPDEAGEATVNGGDWKFYSGGAVKNLSNIGPNVPDWTEDGNSPDTTTAANSVTYTLATPADFVRVFVVAEDVSGSGTNVALQVNGDTGSNYNYRNMGGSQTTGATSFDGAVKGDDANGTGRSIINIVGFGGRVIASGATLANGGTLLGGDNANVSAPITQFTLIAGVSVDWQTEVYTRDVPTA